MKKIFRLTEEQKLLLPLVALGSVTAIVAVIIACVQGTPITDCAAAAWELGRDLLAYSMVCFGMVLFAGLVGVLAYYVDWGVVLQVIKRVGGDFSNSLLSKNANIVSFRLKYFLFGILRRNNQVLHLPLGEDFGCLSPRELIYGCREKCTFYNFDLILPQQPDMDIETLRQIIQSFIDRELDHYGITALNSCFYSKAMGWNYWSVYLNRLTYIEAQHRLSFEVLYVCSEESAQYLVKAIQRDKHSEQPEIEVFDDDV